jgi:hypothetical protein
MLIGTGCGDASTGRSSGGAESGIGTLSTASGSTTAAFDTETASGTGADAITDTAPADEGPMTKFDMGEPPDVGGLPDQEGCTKVDFLFVIDNSGSMGDDQVNLVTNFPAFIEGIQATLQDVDAYQVGVITTDDYEFNVAGCNVLGGLVARTGGQDSSDAQCGPYATGANFMTEQDDLPQAFACAAKVGTDGSGSERPMQALQVAVQKQHGDPGECNEGFLRDDALLVIVIITDEADGPGDPGSNPSPGTPQDWHDAVVQAKAGIAENIVVVSLIHDFGGPCPPSSAVADGANIAAFTELFGDNGFVGGICSDYGPLFAQATGIIDGACQNFMPPG